MKQKKLMWGGSADKSEFHGQEPDKKRVRDITLAFTATAKSRRA
jgi:hypothetical protein